MYIITITLKQSVFKAISLIAIIFLTVGITLRFANKSENLKGQVKTSPVPSSAQVKGESIESNLKSLPLPKNGEAAAVKRVIDGDTIELESGQRVRYIGVDTPETVDPRKPVQCFGKEASAKNHELVEGKSVILEKDISETDKYGRLLRYVYLQPTDSPNPIFVNDYLVRQGFAHSSSYPPDIKYQDIFRASEDFARQNNLGLWSACTGGSSAAQSQTQAAPNPNCVIKGNISASGEKIYHVPGQNYYEKTVIDESKGERWFCTEAEAQTAGWRKSKS